MAKDEAEKRVAPNEEVRAVEDTDQNQDTDITEDTALPVKDEEPTAEPEKTEVVVSPDHRPVWKRAYAWVLTHKKISIPVGSAVVVVLALAAIPFTRYALAGMVLAQRYSVKVVDAETKQPVSSAEVILAGKKTTTDGRGQATVEVPVGSATLQVSKKYYKTASQDVLVPIGRQKQPQQVSLVATGRQVPMIVINSLTKKPVADVELRALDTKARTDKQGKAVLVVPAGKETLDVTVEAKGYNPLKQVVIFQQGVVVETSVQLVPAGKVYFLSNKSGKIDVVKANLDGSDRTVVVAGTGKEDRYNTSLLASRDWKYLALYAKRDSDKPKLYLIDTSADKMTVMDEGDAEFTLSGWSGHTFIYTVLRTNVAADQAKRQALKGFNATAHKLTTLDETRAQADGAGSYVFESFGSIYILDNEIFYTKNWGSGWRYYFSNWLYDGKQATLNSVKPDGSAKKVIKGYDRAGQSGSIFLSARSYGPQEIYIVHTDDPNAKVDEYEDGQVKVASSVSRDSFFNDPYPTYLISPSGEKTFWTEGRDGKSVFFLGNKQGKDEKQLGALREYQAYGWYTEDYLLLTKNGSELYVLPAETINDNTAPQKITDYYRSRTYEGYGYGYGGL